MSEFIKDSRRILFPFILPKPLLKNQISACLQDFSSHGTALVIQFTLLASNAVGAVSIPGQRTKTPHVMWPKNETKQKQPPQKAP